MSHPYEDLSASQFEALIVQYAKHLLGKGVQPFSEGPDGGRDARFHGTADGYPSRSDPWCGITIIQAKHTSSFSAFSDPTFSGDNSTSVLSLEAKRIKKLVGSKSVDNYLLCSNRHLSGLAVDPITDFLAMGTGLPRDRIRLCGIADLDEALREKPKMWEYAGIQPFNGPLIVTSRELSDVVEAVADAISALSSGDRKKPQKRVDIEKKNEINRMSEKMFNLLMRYYAYTFESIRAFLALPANEPYRDLYSNCAEQFNIKIIAKQRPEDSFDDVYSHIVDLLIKRDTVLGRNQKLTRAMVFYMYWNCDIGEVVDQDDISLQV